MLLLTAIVLALSSSVALAQDSSLAGNTENGKKLFATYFCWSCHGSNGRAGRLRPSPLARAQRKISSNTFASRGARCRPIRANRSRTRIWRTSQRSWDRCRRTRIRRRFHCWMNDRHIPLLAEEGWMRRAKRRRRRGGQIGEMFLRTDHPGASIGASPYRARVSRLPSSARRGMLPGGK